MNNKNIDTSNESFGENTKDNTESLIKVNKRLGSPVTYFLKKNSVNGSLEKGISEANEILQDLAKLKESGDSALYDSNGNLLIEKLDD